MRDLAYALVSFYLGANLLTHLDGAPRRAALFERAEGSAGAGRAPATIDRPTETVRTQRRPSHRPPRAVQPHVRMPSRVLVHFPEPATPKVVDRSPPDRPAIGEEFLPGWKACDYNLVRGGMGGARNTATRSGSCPSRATPRHRHHSRTRPWRRLPHQPPPHRHPHSAGPTASPAGPPWWCRSTPSPFDYTFPRYNPQPRRHEDAARDRRGGRQGQAAGRSGSASTATATCCGVVDNEGHVDLRRYRRCHAGASISRPG